MVLPPVGSYTFFTVSYEAVAILLEELFAYPELEDVLPVVLPVTCTLYLNTNLGVALVLLAETAPEAMLDVPFV